MISFDVTTREAEVINRIALRMKALVAKVSHPEKARKVQDYQMDVTAVHANGCPLKLEELLAADDFNFFHDLAGIERHLDRNDRSPTAGQLLDCFLPRYAQKARDTIPGDSPRMQETIAAKRAGRGL